MGEATKDTCGTKMDWFYIKRAKNLSFRSRAGDAVEKDTAASRSKSGRVVGFRLARFLLLRYLPLLSDSARRIDSAAKVVGVVVVQPKLSVLAFHVLT
ncbi:hypothetical protein DD238_003562 [Peronospora effusa]|uniref:Uncharacterized protein n=1 Tax=Peronospora effusa TaxID=542832 RepID=A0A3M6VP59_9STRA|nr:hypothetical protein DD238_003562 [Peronospora effusa]RQM10461.1 hypothetical protein DD237_003911 [Peronospora effusa]